MKYLSRLTALLLAFVLLFSSSVGVIAESDISDLTRSGYDQMVSAAKEAAEAEAAAAAQEAASQPIINEGGVVYAQDIPEQTKRFDIYEVITDAQLSMGGETEITLPQSGKINLSAGTAAQWQIYIPGADMWVNIAGETGDTFALTYAVIGGMLSGGSAKVRALAGDSAAVANVSVAYGSALPPVEEEDTFVAEAAAASTFALRRSASTSDANAGIMLAAETPELKEYSVVINYVFENNAIVADPYTATLAAGSNFSATVNHPTIMGYLPFIGNATETSTKIDLNITNIQENVTYTVIYRPTNVDYTVIHYHQNLNDDNYSEFERETLEGLTKSTVPEVANSYDGFYALLYEKPEIAADGSTVVEIYYDRYYYLMNFELAGGYGVEPIYARYGTPISVGEPTRMGYTFNGWTPSIPATMPVDGGTYTANWTAGGTTYTVVYWAENANDSDYSYWGYATKSATAGATVSGSDDFNGTTDLPKTGFHFDHADQNVTVKGDGSTVVNVYYKRNTYTLIFAYSDGALICDTHVHSTDCYELVCGKEEHEHTYEGSYRKGSFMGGTTYYVGGCYPEGNTSAQTGGATSGNVICGKEEHEHTTGDYWTDSCYGDERICGLTGVNNHSHSVANGCYGMKFENVKYGQATDAYWAQAPALKWKVTSNGTTFYTNAPAMPNSNLIIYGTSQSGSSVIHYYEKVDGQETTNKVREDYTVGTDGWSFTSEDYIEIPGFTYSSSRKNNAGTQYYIYYTRNSYTLTFKNGSETKSGGTHLYQADISDTYYVPTYTGDDAEAYTFGGWYTTEKCIEGTQFDFEKNTMPYNNLILYAKWVPVTHTVTFYLEEKKIDEGAILDTVTVPHGSKVDPTPDEPTNGSYDFVGWFYKENGVEKAFDFANMPVNRDLVVYGKWSSNVLKQYVVYFKIKGKDTEIADRITGSALAGETKTFDAKGEEELYAGYKEGYFPLVQSHSMKLEINTPTEVTDDNWTILTDENGNQQIVQCFTFEYVQKDAVPYTVYYVAETLKDGEDASKYQTIERDGKTYYIIADTYTKTDNRKAVVTEKFKVVAGYMPDAYQKRLVVDGTDGAVNEIIFYYSVDSTHAYYKITHYTQNTDGKNWTEYTSSEAKGDIGTTYTADPLTIDGFTYDPNVAGTVVSGELTADGLELKLYYTRNSYPYEVRYLEQGTGTKLAEPKDGTGLYGQVISESAIDIENYTAVAPTSETLTIKVEESQTEAKLNIITFYYTENTVPINYIPVGPDNQVLTGDELTEIGSVSPTTENVKIITGVAGGSTATLHGGPTYKFVGWYSDAECKTLVSTNPSYVPEKVDGKNVAATYYAKFEWNVSTLVVKKDGLRDGESAIAKVTAESADHGTQNFTITLTGPNASATITGLLVGSDYSVSEDTGWTWSYDYKGGTNLTGKILAPNVAAATATLTNEKDEQWLYDESAKVNDNNNFSTAQ